jgi:hypothetical protein
VDDKSAANRGASFTSDRGMKAPIASAAGDGAAQTVFVIILVLALGAIVFLRLNRRIRRRTAYVFGAVAGLALVVIAFAIYRGAP